GFNTLVAEVKAAGLAETLQGPGPFTVFAPTDAAFAKLPAGTIDELLADKAKLASILTYHVVAGKVMAADIVKTNGATPTTVNGLPLDVVVRDGKVYVNGAQVVTADIAASNGVIHVIDAVLLPKAAPVGAGRPRAVPARRGRQSRGAPPRPPGRLRWRARRRRRRVPARAAAGGRRLAAVPEAARRRAERPRGVRAPHARTPLPADASLHR